MWLRMALWPWWLRWLTSAVWMLAIGVPLWVFLIADEKTGVWPVVVQSGVLGVGISGLLTMRQQPIHHCAVALVAGLDRVQRVQAIRSVGRGEFPTDPAVLAAGIGLGSLVLSQRAQAPRWAVRFGWVPPLLLVVMAIGSLIFEDGKRGIAYGVLALLLVVVFWRDARTTRIVGSRIEAMRSMAQSGRPDIEAVTGPIPQPVPTRRMWLAFGAVVLTASTASVTASAVHDRAQSVVRTDCRTAIDTEDVFLSKANRELTDGRRIGAGGPPISAYQDWAKRLGEHERIVTPQVASRVVGLADKAGRAVALVRQARTDGIDRSALVQNQLDYQRLIGAMLDDVEAVHNYCLPVLGLK
ncbi:hypothetical protein ABFW00_20810 [Mycobacteroides abscessus]|uniref:hypothetical protein n=1 Tax=Mycobacteroides abscessus TaxID=36809 RepID=UPI0034CE164A